MMTLKGAVCKFLTLLKHKNTIICLQICKKHAKLTYLFIWKNNATVSYSPLKMCIPCQNVCLCFGLCNPPTASLPNCISAPRDASWQKTQRFHFSHGSCQGRCARFCWCLQSGNLRVPQVWGGGAGWKKPSPIFWIWTAIPSSPTRCQSYIQHL